MVQPVVVAILLVVALYLVYLYFTSSRKLVIEETFEVPGPAPIITQPIPEPERTIQPGGPNSPSQAPPHNLPAERLPGPEDSDPYDETYGSSNIKDNMRYPERLFGPAPQPTETAIAVGADVASPEQAVVSQALQTFSPDFAQNGGQFIDGGIFANDTYQVPNYSAL
jgi:hypothetical protein